MDKQVTLSVLQMDIVWGRPEANLDRAEGLVGEAARRGSRLVLLPELWTSAYDLERAGEHAVEPDSPGWARLAGMARMHHVYLAGSVLRRERGRVYNSALMFGPEGQLVESYDKVHLFGGMDEDRYLAPGTRTPVLDLPFGRLALAICYDLRFPELFRTYALAGAELILVPAEWPYPRLEHWRTLLRARAIENQVFVAACNRVGSGGGAEFFGHSAVIDAYGRTAAEAGEGEVMLTVTIDLRSVAGVRSHMPVFADRRSDLYG